MFGLASFLEVTSELKTILAPWLEWGQICHLATRNKLRVEHNIVAVLSLQPTLVGRRWGKTQYSVQHYS